MAELVLNKFRIELVKEKLPTKINFFIEKDASDCKYYFARYKPSKILNDWDFIKGNDEIENWLNGLKKENIKDEEHLYLSFFNIKNPTQQFEITFSDLPNFLKKKFLKEIFIITIKNKFIIDPNKEGCDFCVYRKNEDKSNQYDSYTRFDFVIDLHLDNYEVSISIGSTDTYIVKLPANIQDQITDTSRLKMMKDNLLIKNNQNNIFNYPIKANAEIRKLLNITQKPKKKFYKKYFDELSPFIKKISETLQENIVLHTNFKSITEIKIVSFEKNKMIFKDGNEDFATVNGMRDYGPYYIPQNIKETQLLFIYPDSDSANKLYSYLSRGFRHFPGLESYVGIPTNIFSTKINYNNDVSLIVNKIQEELTKSEYKNLIAVCIMPFSKSTANKVESKIYYQIKKVLLEKNIPSQFIHRNKIFEENFHFSLPNIAIAMLAKCGGIPWKLARPHYNQLTIGFNIFSINENGNNQNKYLGSAVFFDNEGVLRRLESISGDTLDNISEILSRIMEEYKKSSEQVNNKVVIHFYKSISNKDANYLEKKIKELLGKETFFAIVEINDTKTSIDLAFDLSYESYMPQSGTYIILKPNEYLLFNNLRYWEKPINPINQEELPLKIRIFDPYNSFDPNELISQVYEFSRMYWKSLKQKAQPVTTIYSKLVAEYTYEFGGTIPDNEVARKRVWFI